jgi:hypothetical protein
VAELDLLLQQAMIRIAAQDAALGRGVQVLAAVDERVRQLEHDFKAFDDMAGQIAHCYANLAAALNEQTAVIKQMTGPESGR